MTPYRPALILACALGLAACKGEKKAADQRTAVGEILPGSVSDAMIPYDSLRSQPPLAPATGAAGTHQAKGRAGDDAADAPQPTASEGDAVDATETAPAPAAEPTAE